MIDTSPITNSTTQKPPGRAAPAIEARDLVKTYGGKVRALDGLSFNVDSGAIFALLGPNGAGKSTTIKILNTLSRPDSGSARVAGFDVTREPQRVRRAIGCVAQKSSIDPDATGRENLTLQGRIYGLRGRELKTRVEELLKRFRLTEAADFISRSYSGGMQRKLDIAMGLVHRPRALFLDEPTTGFDPEARADLWDDISRLANEDGITILLTTHYLEEADRLAGRLAIVDRGKLVVEGTPDRLKGELLGDAVHIEFARPEIESRVREALQGVGGLSEIVVEGRSLHARATQGATAVPGMLAALESKELKVASVTVARPSLDDVYLRYTGRTFKEADQEPGSGQTGQSGRKGSR
jgi:ABC-2 type transport system ATP-binding protein